MKLFEFLIRPFIRIYYKKRSKREYENQNFKRMSERSIEYRFVFKTLTEEWPRTVLDI